jgi:uncharacterized membrane protein
MDVLFNTVYARACMGAGLSVLTGLRAFLPIAFLALYSRLEFASAPILTDTPFAFLEKMWVVITLLVLAVIELAMDKTPAILHSQKTARICDSILRPIKILLGGVVFAAAMAPDGWIVMVVCGVLGLAIAGLAHHVRGSFRPDHSADTAPLVFYSVYEDILVLIGTLLFVLVPIIGVLFALFLILLVYRIRRRSRRKHKGLRILKG